MALEDAHQIRILNINMHSKSCYRIKTTSKLRDGHLIEYTFC